jgi:uncharacterized membrane protein (DUF373 family)
MEDYTSDIQEQDSTSRSHHPILPTRHHKPPIPKEHQHSYRHAGRLLDRADTFIYAIVGICFLLGAILALGYTFWDLSVQAFIVIPNEPALDQRPVIAAGAIIQFVSGLLLVLIIMEVLGTVIHYLKSHETSLRPFLFIGIISATRSILSIGARLSVATGAATSADAAAKGTEFMHAMIELGVSAAVILALGITIKLLGNLVDDDSTKD